MIHEKAKVPSNLIEPAESAKMAQKLILGNQENLVRKKLNSFNKVA